MFTGRSSLFYLTGVIVVIGLAVGANRLFSPAARTAQRSGESLTVIRSPLLVSGALIGYDDSRSSFIRFDLASNKQTPIEFGTLPSSALVRWGTVGQRLLVLRVDHQPTNWESVKLDNGTATQLHPNVDLPILGRDETKILYLFQDSAGTTTLTSAQADGSEWQSLVRVPAYSDLWWSPLETYAIGLNNLANPPRYELISLSSKMVKPLADGSGRLRWSPDGKRALIDRAEGVVAIASVESDQLTEIEIDASVATLVWESDTALVGAAGTKLVRVDLTKQTQTTVGAAAPPPDEVLGLHRGSLIGVVGNSIYRYPLN